MQFEISLHVSCQGSDSLCYFNIQCGHTGACSFSQKSRESSTASKILCMRMIGLGHQSPSVLQNSAQQSL